METQFFVGRAGQWELWNLVMNRLAPSILFFAATALAQASPSLTVGDVTYEDVQLKKEYPASLFIQHKDGMVFVEKSKLTEEQIASITNVNEPAAEARAEGESSAELAKQESGIESKTDSEPSPALPPESKAQPEPSPVAPSAEKSTVGQEATDMRLIDANQEETSLTALRGKVVLLNFNFGEGGCDETCNPDFPILAELQAKYSAKPVEVVSVLTTFNDWNWERAMQNRAITWKTTVPEKFLAGTVDEKETPEKLKHLKSLETQGYTETLFAAYDIKTLASNVVVDKNGIIVGHFGSLNGSREKVEEAIAKALAN